MDQTSLTTNVRFKDIHNPNSEELLSGNHGTNSASSYAHKELEKLISDSTNGVVLQL